jgi:ABC-type proline/glycine betaine transport system ATPase subunit
LGALDRISAARCRTEALALQRRTGHCFVHVTHDPGRAWLARLIVVMDKGQIRMLARAAIPCPSGDPPTARHG